MITNNLGNKMPLKNIILTNNSRISTTIQSEKKDSVVVLDSYHFRPFAVNSFSRFCKARGGYGVLSETQS